MTLYNIKSALDDFRITKFDDNLNVESSYLLEDAGGGHGVYTCECPAGVRPSCRHREMLPLMLAYEIVDTDLFVRYGGKGDLVVCDINGVAAVPPSARVAVVPEAEPKGETLPGHTVTEAPFPPAKSANGVGHHSEARASRPAFGSDLPPGVRLLNQKGNWRRI
jgi:hypothetical protein